MSINDLKKLTLSQLRDLATAHAVAGAAKLKKDELIAKLAAKLTAPAPAGAISMPTGRAPAPSSLALGSSSTKPAAPARIGPEPGLPIPDRYGRDRLVLMVQDPWHIFAYWEINPDSLARISAAAGPGWATVLLVQTAHGVESREVDVHGGNYYLTVAPGSTLRAELALRDQHGRLHLLATSNEIITPAAGPSDRQDETWMAVDETFGELLNRAGLPGSSGSSSERLSSAAVARRTVLWNLVKVDSHSMSSGILQGGLSSRSLSSLSLSSRELHKK